ncbi:uncharacterized protein LOC109833806 [Asparagus officinalis]|uniref:uncharacterized protein LOC109833806 n=1 Tax=Asparagus officinalis TaxID=4686 RepID=UPI00098E25BA|nr:uncharacterized protein LOC109833806 [Asparagus officinalis]
MQTVCQSKEHGGLGVFSAKAWNTAASMKLIWMIHFKKDLLWIKWVHGSYLRQSDIWQVQSKANDSWMWKQILKMRDKVIFKFGSASNVQNIIARSCSGGNVQLSTIYNDLINQNAQQNACVLRTFQQQETCKHLFFECAFSADLWNRVMEWMNYKWKSCNWDRIIEWYSTRLKGKGFMKKVKRMALTVSVYAIGKERNQRIFRHEAQDPVFVF